MGHFIQVWGSTENSIGKIRTMIDDAGHGVSCKNEVLLEERELTNDIDFTDIGSH